MLSGDIRENLEADWGAVRRLHGEGPYLVRVGLRLPVGSNPDTLLASFWRAHSADGDGAVSACPAIFARLEGARALLGGAICEWVPVVLSRRDLRCLGAYGPADPDDVAAVLVAAGMVTGATKKPRARRARGSYRQ